LHWIEYVALTVEAVGVAVMVAGFLIATYRFMRHPNFYDSRHAYLAYRHGIGRSILVGLDFLIAGDLIKTVIVVNTGEQVATLAAVVLIRAFLGFTLHVEVEGHWPWQNHRFRRDTNDDNHLPSNADI
jgi:uncharacterized membrane protein